MDVAQAMENNPEGEVSEEQIEVHEVPAEEAVIIDPNVQSPLEENTWDNEKSGECGTNINEVPFSENND